jgi:polyisoprenyl-teichoic acid--peptidoglycan teichoic acid transferase
VRSLRRTLVLGLAGLLAWTAGAALGVTPHPRRAAASPLVMLGVAHPREVRNLPSLSGDKPIFILVLGSDARPGQSIIGERSDSIHILGINPAKHRASVLGFPRDSWVDIPGHGTNKINAAMVYGGPRLTIDTVEHLTGIHIDYYLLTWFGGLAHMVNDVGGIVVDVPYPMHDSYSGADFNAGVQRLSGKQALAFSRNRHDTPLGDLSRSQNQGRLLVSALAQFRQEFEQDPSVLLTWIAAGLRNVDTDLSVRQLVSLAFTAASIPPADVKNEVVPATTGSVGSASVVFISASAGSVYADMRDDGLLDHS